MDSEIKNKETSSSATAEEVLAYEQSRQQRASAHVAPTRQVNAAPNPSRVKVLALMSSSTSPGATTTTTALSTSWSTNTALQQGPYSKDPLGPAETSRGKVGEAEHNVALDEVTFDMNRKQFQTKGVALAPDGSTIVKEKGRKVRTMRQSMAYGDHPRLMNYKKRLILRRI